MEVDEYDEFIKIRRLHVRKILPRLYPELDTDPVIRSLVSPKRSKLILIIGKPMRLDAKIIEIRFYWRPKDYKCRNGPI